MIRNDLIQAGIIAALKANTALVDFLTARASVDEIREAQWQGAIFTYPAVRVDLGTQVPNGNGTCHPTMSDLAFSIFSFSELDSSQQADELAGLVDTALFNTRFSGTGFNSLLVDSGGLISASRTLERVWQATGLYTTILFQPTT